MGQPIAEIIRVMSDDPLRFKLELAPYGSMMTEYSVSDKVTGFFFGVGICQWGYTSKDDFEEYVSYARKSSTTNLEWATNFEVQALGLAVEKLKSDHYAIEYNKKAAEKEAQLKHGREKVMALYNLEE